MLATTDRCELAGCQEAMYDKRGHIDMHTGLHTSVSSTGTVREYALPPVRMLAGGLSLPLAPTMNVHWSPHRSIATTTSFPLQLPLHCRLGAGLLGYNDLWVVGLAYYRSRLKLSGRNLCSVPYATSISLAIGAVG